MSILAWIEDQKRLKLLNAPKYVNPASDSSKGLWTRCDKCGVILYIKHLKENQRVCFGCSYHLQMSSQERVENLLDKDSWRPLDETLSPCDPLEFHDQKDYTDRLQEAQERTGLQDAIQTGSGLVEGIPVALGVMDFDFMGGSMGSVVGEKVTRLIEYATQEGLTLILVCASGGARMQEGVFSLMQMAKISSALQIYQSCANLLYISILTSPTTGGVTASFAMLGDIIFAEPKALIAFAGRRVIEQTLCEDLPEDFQTSEYMLHHGLLDLIVPRRFLRQALSESIRLYKNAPFKKAGRIPFGVQNPITFLVEEKIRRQWALGNPSVNKYSTNDTQTQAVGVLTKQSSGATPQQKQALLANKANNSSSNILPAASFAGLNTMLNERVAFTSKNITKKNENELVNSFDSYEAHQKSEVFATLSLSRSVRQNQRVVRNTGKYRDILTSFQTMFDLFSKNIVQPYGISLNTAGSRSFSTQSIEGSKNAHLDFFNKSIELAATESVEWRAFYVYQKISERSGFFEESFYAPPTSKDENNVVATEDSRSRSAISKLRADSHLETGQPNFDPATTNAPQNMLFYRSICRGVN